MPHDSQHDSSGYLYLAIGFSVVGLVVGLSMITRMIGPPSIIVWGAAFVSLALVANGPMGKAIARRISGELPSAQQQSELPDAVYSELDEMRARMLEMEERQDFSERMLASRNELTGKNGEV